MAQLLHILAQMQSLHINILFQFLNRYDAKTGELLGAHMIGAEVTELVQGYGIARTLETTEKELMHTIFPHPTLSEMMHESVLDAFDRVIHM